MTDISTYVQGDLVVVSCDFTDEEGQYTDPATIKLEVLEPGAAAPNEYEFGVGVDIEKIATGRYQLEIDASIPGVWNYYWYAPPGDGQTAKHDSFLVIEKNTEPI